MNTEIHRVNHRIQSEYGKMRGNMFHAKIINTNFEKEKKKSKNKFLDHVSYGSLIQDGFNLRMI